jgi:hypothetical protein
MGVVPLEALAPAHVAGLPVEEMLIGFIPALMGGVGTLALSARRRAQAVRGRLRARGGVVR